MAWSHLDIDKPHLAYMILGGFTSLFMLCSLFVKEKLYIGEATVATLCGIIFGPHAANLFDPASWGNVDKITLECSRIVLVVQCFAIGVELPKAYMERHWKSVTLLLVPVMTWGWLITSLFIWWMTPVNWLQGLVCAACVTATDPVLASSVVGKGKFSKRVPKHLRDLLSAESGCNDGMAFPFIYLSYYILHFKPDVGEVFLHWVCVTILYECVFGAIFGFTIGYMARHMIKFAERKQLIDRESFLVFYFVLAVFCAGSGSLLGMDDLLIGFSAGVGFSNDGWFTAKTEEAHVSNVIDLLLNLAFFVFFGSIIPWQDYNNPEIGLTPWRLVVIAILVIFFRRIPVMLLLKPIIPDVKTWREALFAGHFGPIGVGAIFAAILARAELETHSTQPLPEVKLPEPGDEEFYVIRVIWPVTTFIVISSILVHGSSIAVFTLGKRINTLTITLSYTQANEEGPSWMNRLPRVQSLAKGSMSFRKADEMDASSEETPPGTLPPIGVPGNFLRRVRDEDTEAQEGKAPSLKPPSRRHHKRTPSLGGPVSDSAIAPQRPPSDEERTEAEERDEIEKEGLPASRERDRFGREPEMEVYQEGNNMILEDEEGNVLKTEDISHEPPERQREIIQEQREKLEQEKTGEHAKSSGRQHSKTEGEQIQEAVGKKTGHPYAKARKQLGKWTGREVKPKAEAKQPEGEVPKEPVGKMRKSGKARSAHAYQFGNTIIVEDEDGEVIKKYSIPETEKPEEEQPSRPADGYLKRRWNKMGHWFGKEERPESSQAAEKKAAAEDEWMADDGLRFTVAQDQDVDKRGVNHKGDRMDKHAFIKQIKSLDPKAQREYVRESDASQAIKNAADEQAKAAERRERRRSSVGAADQAQEQTTTPQITEEPPTSESEATEETDEDAANLSVATTLHRFTRGTSADERRRNIRTSPSPSPMRHRREEEDEEEETDSEDDGTERVSSVERRRGAGLTQRQREAENEDTGETPAERRRRLAALGEINDPNDSDSDEPNDEDNNNGFRRVRGTVQFADGTKPADTRPDAGGVSYADNGESSSSGSRGRRRRPIISWGGEKGRDRK